jgi:hypothetical protein
MVMLVLVLLALLASPSSPSGAPTVLRQVVTLLVVLVVTLLVSLVVRQLQVPHAPVRGLLLPAMLASGPLGCCALQRHQQRSQA